MVDQSSFTMSLFCVFAAVSVILFPQRVLWLSLTLNRSMALIDDGIMRYRHVVGLVLFGLSYALFRLALMLPNLWG